MTLQGAAFLYCSESLLRINDALYYYHLHIQNRNHQLSVIRLDRWEAVEILLSPQGRFQRGTLCMRSSMQDWLTPSLLSPSTHHHLSSIGIDQHRMAGQSQKHEQEQAWIEQARIAFEHLDFATTERLCNRVSIIKIEVLFYSTGSHQVVLFIQISDDRFSVSFFNPDFAPVAEERESGEERSSLRSSEGRRASVGDRR